MNIRKETVLHRIILLNYVSIWAMCNFVPRFRPGSISRARRSRPAWQHWKQKKRKFRDYWTGSPQQRKLSPWEIKSLCLRPQNRTKNWSSSTQYDFSLLCSELRRAQTYWTRKSMLWRYFSVHLWTGLQSNTFSVTVSFWCHVISYSRLSTGIHGGSEQKIPRGRTCHKILQTHERSQTAGFPQQAATHE